MLFHPILVALPYKPNVATGMFNSSFVLFKTKIVSHFLFLSQQSNIDILHMKFNIRKWYHTETIVMS